MVSEKFHYEWEKKSPTWKTEELKLLNKSQKKEEKFRLNKTISKLKEIMPEAPIPEMTLKDLLKVDSSYFIEAFDSNKGQFKDWVEKLDKNWRYLEINGKKIYNLDYSVGENGIYYQFFKNQGWNYTIIFGQWENGELKWRWTSINLIWSKFVGQWEKGKFLEWQCISVEGWVKTVREIKDNKLISSIEYDKHGKVIEKYNY